MDARITPDAMALLHPDLFRTSAPHTPNDPSAQLDALLAVIQPGSASKT